MIIVALGANLPGPTGQSPAETLEQALSALLEKGCRLIAQSEWFETEPVPVSDQPWFVNGVAIIETEHDAKTLLEFCFDIEHEFGRERNIRWEARVLDIDIVSFNNEVTPSPDIWGLESNKENEHLVLPHPRMHQRSFVLAPLVAIAPEWQHPVLGETAKDLLGKIEDKGVVRLLK